MRGEIAESREQRQQARGHRTRVDCCSTSSSGKIPCCLWGTPRQAGWISMLVLEQLRNAVQPPGPRTVYLRPSGAPAGAWGDAAREGGVLAAKAVENVWQRQGLSCAVETTRGQGDGQDKTNGGRAWKTR